MNKISFTNDKFLHFIISFLLVGFFFHFLSLTNAVIVTILIGVAKEIYDYFSPYHDFDLEDIIANLVGVFVATVLFAVTLY